MYEHFISGFYFLNWHILMHPAHFSTWKHILVQWSRKPLLPICQMSKNKSCAHDNVLKLLAKSHQNPKSVNKVIAQLVKTSKSLFFHCDVTNDVSLMCMTISIILNLWEKAQVKQLARHEVIVINVQWRKQPTWNRYVWKIKLVRCKLFKCWCSTITYFSFFLHLHLIYRDALCESVSLGWLFWSLSLHMSWAKQKNN